MALGWQLGEVLRNQHEYAFNTVVVGMERCGDGAQLYRIWFGRKDFGQ